MRKRKGGFWEVDDDWLAGFRLWWFTATLYFVCAAPAKRFHGCRINDFNNYLTVFQKKDVLTSFKKQNKKILLTIVL
jgi:hypothetical protein